MKRRLFVGLTAFLITAGPAGAADPCTGATQMDLNACAGAAYDRADAAMN